TANNNSHGIGLHGSYYNTVSGNNANENGGFGIDLSGSENNVISGNIANNNGMGIFLDWSNYNTISGNTANYNGDGIFLLESNYNIVSGNTLQGNGRYCIFEENCIGNTFSDNGSCTYGQDSERIPGYNLFILLGIISVVVIIMGEKLKKS
ncbi:MAG: NosD domain-containing protein, partial [Promethearchaeota archaeon]